DRGAEQDLEQPLVGGELAPVPGNGLLSADHQQRVSRQRIERLDPATLENRQVPERVDVEPLRQRGNVGREKQRSRQGGARGQPGSQLREGGHANDSLTAGRRLKLRCIANPKCTSRPSPTSTQAM